MISLLSFTISSHTLDRERFKQQLPTTTSNNNFSIHINNCHQSLSSSTDSNPSLLFSSLKHQLRQQLTAVCLELSRLTLFSSSSPQTFITSILDNNLVSLSRFTSFPPSFDPTTNQDAFPFLFPPDQECQGQVPHHLEPVRRLPPQSKDCKVHQVPGGTKPPNATWGGQPLAGRAIPVRQRP